MPEASDTEVADTAVAPSSIEIGVVEDSDEDFVALLRAIRKSGTEASVERWARAEDLLDQLQAQPARLQWPKLLLVDLNLPGIDGIDLVARLRAEIPTRPLPMFILSGSTRQADVDRGFASGASLYLQKPLTGEHIDAAVKLLGAAPRG